MWRGKRALLHTCDAMLIYKSLCRITEKKLRNNEQPDIFFAVKAFWRTWHP
jgi:hypothetical protein